MESVTGGEADCDVDPPAMLGTIDKRVAGGDRRRVFFQIADVFVVQIHVDEAAQLAFVVKELLAQVGELRGQRAQHFADGRAGQLHRIVLVGVLAQRGRNQDFGHIRSSFSAAV